MFYRPPPQSNELLGGGEFYDNRVVMAVGSEGTSTKKLRNSANIISPIRKIPELILKDKIVNSSARSTQELMVRSQKNLLNHAKKLTVL